MAFGAVGGGMRGRRFAGRRAGGERKAGGEQGDGEGWRVVMGVCSLRPEMNVAMSAMSCAEKRLRLRLHGRMLALALLVFGQRVDQVLRRLPADPRHVVVRIGVLVAGDAVAALAGVGQFLAALGTAGQRCAGPRRRLDWPASMAQRPASGPAWRRQMSGRRRATTVGSWASPQSERREGLRSTSQPRDRAIASV